MYGCTFCRRADAIGASDLSQAEVDVAIKALFDQADRASVVRRAYGHRHRRNRRNKT